LYRAKDHLTTPLFAELFPFGGKIDNNNRWLKIARLIPWDSLVQAFCGLETSAAVGGG